MINEIYLIIFLGWIILILGLVFREFTISALGSLLLITIGVFGVMNGIDGINNLATLTLSIINIAIGAFIIWTGAIEQMKTN